ncbi:MAG: virulence RhuM family protein [Candidatus Symbiothrix sp.]|nr:virulence RhuM family protein [Candidatus Symbiothrix sp.]
MNKKDEIVFYQTNSSIRLAVRVGNETVWLTQTKIAELFGVKQPAISKHLKNIYDSGELDENSTYSILEYMGNDGKQAYQTKYYNLDAILSVGYRVNSIHATQFRIWATSVLKDYILKGYAVNQRFEQIEQRVTKTENKIDLFVNKSLPPMEGIFYDGQVFDAYTFASNLIKSATNTIILIDNYIDENVLLLLSKRVKGVKATIYTPKISPQFKLDLTKHQEQYSPIAIEIVTNVHDRFLIIDDEVYHIGASLKDLGKKLVAFTKMGLKGKELLYNLHQRRK